MYAYLEGFRMIFNIHDNNSNLDPYLNELLNVAFEYETVVEIEETDTGAYLWSSRSVNGLKVKKDGLPEGPNTLEVESFSQGHREWIEFGVSQVEENSNRICLYYRGSSKKAKEILAGVFGNLVDEDRVVM